MLELPPPTRRAARALGGRVGGGTHGPAHAAAAPTLATVLARGAVVAAALPLVGLVRAAWAVLRRGEAPPRGVLSGGRVVRPVVARAVGARGALVARGAVAAAAAGIVPAVAAVAGRGRLGGEGRGGRGRESSGAGRTHLHAAQSTQLPDQKLFEPQPHPRDEQPTGQEPAFEQQPSAAASGNANSRIDAMKYRGARGLMRKSRKGESQRFRDRRAY